MALERDYTVLQYENHSIESSVVVAGPERIVHGAPTVHRIINSEQTLWLRNRLKYPRDHGDTARRPEMMSALSSPHGS